MKRINSAGKGVKDKKQENKAARKVPSKNLNTINPQKSKTIGQLGKPSQLRTRDTIPNKKKNN